MSDPRDSPYRRRTRPRPDEARQRSEQTGNSRAAGKPRKDGPRRGPAHGPGRSPREEGAQAHKPARHGVVGPGGPRRGLRELPEEMAKLADGRIERLRGPRRSPAQLADDRIGYVLAGVRNHDARAVYDARVAQLRAARAAGDRAAMGRGLCDARRMTLWRARAVVDFAAFAESVAGIASDQAETLAQAAAAAAGVSLEPLPPHVIALWMRLEAALARTCPEATVQVTGDGEAIALSLRIPGSDVGRAIEGFFDMGGAASGLRRFLQAPEPQAVRRPRDRS